MAAVGVAVRVMTAHGTNAGYQKHRRLGSIPCLACCDGHAAYERVRRARAAGVRPVRDLMGCGTLAAYRRHIRRGEQACEECKNAQALHCRRYSRKRRAAA